LTLGESAVTYGTAFYRAPQPININDKSSL